MIYFLYIHHYLNSVLCYMMPYQGYFLYSYLHRSKVQGWYKISLVSFLHHHNSLSKMTKESSLTSSHELLI